MSEVLKGNLFNEDKVLEVKVDGFDVAFNIVRLVSGGFRAYMLVVKLYKRNVDDVVPWVIDAGKLDVPYVIKTNIDPRDVEGLKAWDLERSAVELVKERLAGYMPCIRKHRKALVEYIKAKEELRRLDIEHDDSFI